MSIKGFKAMSADMTCREFKFKVGKTYTTDTVTMCSSGFHFCENAFDVYNYYPKSVNTVVCEIEALGEVLKEGDKSATNKIKIIRKLTETDLLNLWIKRTNSGYGNSGNRNSGDWNSGDWNSGYGNSGNRNSGDGNSGDWNSGNRNSGNRNSGDGNSGDWNSGNRNSGYGNSGNRNSGYGNSGNRNSGDWNSGDGNSGYFNTTIPVYLFNKPSTMVYSEEFENRIRGLSVKPILEWVGMDTMTEEEKTIYPSHKTTGGFLRKTDRFDWRYLTNEDKEFIKALPNFDDSLFKQISNGVSLSDNVEVTINGKTKTISKAKAIEMGLIEE
jgi:hypothetical protein